MLQSLKTEAQYGRAKFYHSDGTGRDGYISHDNGGLTQQQERCRQPPVGGFHQFRSKQSYKPSSSHKTLHYISDGSGRDNYGQSWRIDEYLEPVVLVDRIQIIIKNPQSSKVSFQFKFKDLNQVLYQSRKLSRPKNKTMTFQQRVQTEMQRQQILRTLVNNDK